MSEPANTLFYGDNLEILRRYVADESVDLIYLDPPFNSNAEYNVLYAEKDGTQAHAQIKAFGDTWTWDQESARAYTEVLQSGHGRVALALKAFHDFLGGSDMLAYLSMMALRLIELRRVLKPEGSIYLHCDPTASHYLKIVMDAVFGAECYLNEIIWKRTHAHGSAKRFGPVHDVILFYGRSRSILWRDPRVAHHPDYIKKHFKLADEEGRRFQPITLTGSGTRNGDSGKPWRGINPTDSGRHWAIPGAVMERLKLGGTTVQDRLDALDGAGRIYWPAKQKGKPRLKWYLDELEGTAIPDVWTDIDPIPSHAAERLGYPTQKPSRLLERIVEASSAEGDVVLDPFCGCGTTVAAAQKLGRRWIGVDITHLAINLIKVRLADAFGAKIAESYRVVGEPEDLSGARALAQQDKYQFQFWALGLVNARPVEEKKGADEGIDGRLYLVDRKGTTRTVILSVKGGGVTVAQVRDLRGVVEREDAAIGVFISLEEPTKTMRQEAAEAGFWQTGSVGKSSHPRLQLLTIEELLAGKRIDMPAQQEIRSFKQAPKTKGKQADQSHLF